MVRSKNGVNRHFVYLIVGRNRGMTKRRQTIKIRLPRYERNHLQWRKAIHEALIAASTDIDIRPDDLIELIVTLYFDRSAVIWHDVDNRLKDIMDALQGRVGGPKAIKPRNPVLPNDNQVYRVQIEKVVATKQSLGKGHLIVRKYVPRRGSA
jgi:Holliday junction resolvase RusA-like endonuclease